MKVDVRLHAVLKERLPNGQADVEIDEGSTISDLLDRLGIESEFRELVTVNGAQSEDLGQVLSEGDHVQVFPAVAGGAQRSAYIEEGIRLFNEGKYFLSHETFEEYWVDAPAGERDFLQGLIHLAVGLHHYRRGNFNGARSQWFKAQRRLSGYGESHEGVNLDSVRKFLSDGLLKLEKGENVEALDL